MGLISDRRHSLLPQVHHCGCHRFRIFPTKSNQPWGPGHKICTNFRYLVNVWKPILSFVYCSTSHSVYSLLLSLDISTMNLLVLEVEGAQTLILGTWANVDIKVKVNMISGDADGLKIFTYIIHASIKALYKKCIILG